jgi:nucleoside-diphosphate-sugar epimerase
VLVTGASGHLGANLVRAAVARGDEVRALVRASSDRRGLRGPRFGGKDADLTRDIPDDVAGGCLVCDASRARRDLGWTARPAAEALEDAVRWLLFVDALAPRVGRRLRATLPVAAPGFV